MSDTQNADDATADLPDNPTPSPASASKPPPPLPPIGLRQPNNPLQNLPAPIRQLFGIPSPQPTGPQIAEQRKTQPSYPYSPTGPFPRWPPPWHYAKWQNYVPAQPRDHGQWGQPGAYPNPPARWENPGLYTQIGNFFSQNGSFLSGQNGILLNAFNGAYMKGVMQGQEALAQLEHTKMTNHLLKMEQDEQDQQIQYSDIFDTYGANLSKLQGDPTGGSMMVPEDPNDPNSRKISLHDALWNKAIELHDTNMQRRMMTDGAAGAYKLLQDRDQKWQDLHASNVQRVKEETADKDLAPFTQPGATPNADGTPNTEGPPMARDIAPTGSEGPPTAGPMPAPNVQPPAPEPPPGPAEAPSDGQPGDGGGFTPKLDLPGAEAGQPAAAPLDQQAAAAPDQTQPNAPSAQAQPVSAGAPGDPSQFQVPPGAQLAQADTGGPSATDGGVQPSDQPQYRVPPVTPATTHSGVPFDTKQIDTWAHSYLDNPQETMTALKAMGKNVTEQFLPQVLNRAQQLNTVLGQIQADPRLKGPAVLKAVGQVDPQMAANLKAYIDGSIPPPRGISTLKPPWNRIIALGNKIDPSFTGATFQTRAGVLRDFTSGTDGRNLVSIATAYAHLHAVQDDMKQIPSGLLAQYFGKYKGIGPLVATPEQQAALNRLDNDINTASAEYERALTGGKPTVSGRDDQMADLDYRKLTTQAIQGNIQAKIDRLKERMDRLKSYFTAGTGRQPEDMFKLFGQFSASGADKAGADDLGATSTAAPGMGEGLRQLDGEQHSGSIPDKPPPGWKFEPVQ